MFGFTKLTPEEKQERDLRLRIAELNSLLKTETEQRQASLAKSEAYTKELETLEKK